MKRLTKKIAIIFSLILFLQPIMYANSDLNNEIIELETEITKMTMRIGKYADMDDEKLEDSLSKAKKELKNKKEKAKKENEKKMKQIGNDFKKAGKEFGKNMKKAGKDIGKNMKDAGKEIGNAFKNLSEDE